MNNAFQSIGNKSKVATITDARYLSAKTKMEATFKDVLGLKPHASLFPWRGVSNIRVGLLDDAIQNISSNAQHLKNPPSLADISRLTQACRSFQLAYLQVLNKLYR